MRPDLIEPLDMGLVRVTLGDAQDLEVGALLVAHFEHSDRARPDVTARKGRLVDDQERVRVVPVIGPSSLDEPVVEVVVDGRREHPIEPEDTGMLIELVLVPAAPRKLPILIFQIPFLILHLFQIHIFQKQDLSLWVRIHE